ncbi:MAG TPA: glycosyltransferase, partial [Longimicrobiaceae bacterium]|nr:glycosyltransferase [Longimicrobiaceae bacterium]
VRPPVRVHPPGEVRAALGIPPSAPVVGTVARLARQKRVDRLLGAVSNLPSSVHCVVAGDGGEREKLAALAGELGIAERVHFLGAREDLGDVLGAMDVFVLSSGSEGMSSAMLEALAAGVPVVSTPVSGTEEALEPLADGRRPGVVLASFDPAELARTLAGLLADPGRLAGMGAAARERAQERFGVEVMLDRWERVLRGAGV